MTRIEKCRSCSSVELTSVLDLGPQPIANALLSGNEDSPEAVLPLEVAFCGNCSLLQVTETVPPEILFGRDYPYYSSYSTALLEHSRDHVSDLLRERELGYHSLVLEIAGNDGYLLRNFVEAKVKVLNIDPARGPATIAKAKGIPTEIDFFGSRLAHQLVNRGAIPDVIIANNVLAHVDEINDFFQGISILLRGSAIAEVEVAYLKDLIEACAFDTIYHEHLFYYSISSLQALAHRHGLYLNDATCLSIHGGSIRVRLSKRPGESERLRNLLDRENDAGMRELTYYLGFADQVAHARTHLLDLIDQLKNRGARIAAYGAAAKGATLLNFVGLTTASIEYVVDKNDHKVGKFMPGSRLPIRAVDALVEDRPDYLLLLAWNFAEEIVGQQADFVRRGGRFIIPVPLAFVVGEKGLV